MTNFQHLMTLSFVLLASLILSSFAKPTDFRKKTFSSYRFGKRSPEMSEYVSPDKEEDPNDTLFDQNVGFGEKRALAFKSFAGGASTFGKRGFQDFAGSSHGFGKRGGKRAAFQKFSGGGQGFGKRASAFKKFAGGASSFGKRGFQDFAGSSHGFGKRLYPNFGGSSPDYMRWLRKVYGKRAGFKSFSGGASTFGKRGFKSFSGGASTFGKRGFKSFSGGASTFGKRGFQNFAGSSHGFGKRGGKRAAFKKFSGGGQGFGKRSAPQSSPHHYRKHGKFYKEFGVKRSIDDDEQIDNDNIDDSGESRQYEDEETNYDSDESWEDEADERSYLERMEDYHGLPWQQGQGDNDEV